MTPEKRKENNRKYYLRHKDNIKAKSATYYKDNKEKVLSKLIFKTYGITTECYKEMLEKQGNGCEICGKKGKKALAIDHNHKTGTVRGLLCNECNLSVGFFEKENADKIPQYLSKYN